MGPQFRNAARGIDGERKQMTGFFPVFVGSTAPIRTLDADAGIAPGASR